MIPWYQLVLIVLLAPSLTTAATSQSVSSTTYVGGYGVPGEFFFTALVLEDTGGVLSGKMHQSYDRADTPPFRTSS